MVQTRVLSSSTLRAKALHQSFRFRPSQSFLASLCNPPAIDPDSTGVRRTRPSVQFTANQTGGSKAPKSCREARAEGTCVPMLLSRPFCQLRAGCTEESIGKQLENLESGHSVSSAVT